VPEFIDSGASRVLSKPYNRAQIKEVLDRTKKAN